MTKSINMSLVKKMVASLLVVVAILSGIGINAFAASYVETKLVTTMTDCASGVFTIPSTDNILAVSLRAYTVSGSPSTCNVYVQKKGLFGWSTVKSSTISVNNQTVNPWGIINVSPGEQYRVIGSMAGYSGTESTCNLVISFASNHS